MQNSPSKRGNQLITGLFQFPDDLPPLVLQQLARMNIMKIHADRTEQILPKMRKLL